MCATPFIHPIRTPLGHYFYDVNTNQFIQVEAPVYAHLAAGGLPRSEDPAVRDTLLALEKEGLLSAARPKKLRHVFSDDMADLLDRSLQQITLQLTQECNFRCAYCVYTQNDFEAQRSHSAKRMDRETAFRAIDFLAAHSQEWDSPAISFYGGEPLLEFPLLKEAVLYAEKVFEGRNLLYSIGGPGPLYRPAKGRGRVRLLTPKKPGDGPSPAAPDAKAPTKARLRRRRFCFDSL